MRLLLLLVVAIMAACGDDPGAALDAAAIDATDTGGVDAIAVDAPPDARDPNLSCATAALPTTAPETATVSGIVFSTEEARISGATITFHLRANDALVASATSATDGSYSLAIQTGGIPVDGYFVITAEGYLTVYRYFGYPVAADVVTNQRIESRTVVDLLASINDLTVDWERAQAIVGVRDCDLALISGATVAFAPEPTTTATAPAGMCNALSAGSNVSTECLMYALGFQPGTATIDATLGGTAFHTQGDVKVLPDSLTFVTLQPARVQSARRLLTR